MAKTKGPASRVPFSRPVKLALLFIVVMFMIYGAMEWYMLENPDVIAPISWASWWLVENAQWISIPTLSFFAALASHIFWFRRAEIKIAEGTTYSLQAISTFWAPISLRTAIIISVGTLVSIAATKAWMLLAVMAGMMGGVMFAHKYWFRLEHFDEHLAQFHEED